MNTEKLPETLLEVVTYFADEARAHAFFVAMRWPDGVRCVHCGSETVGKLVTATVKGKEGKPDKVRRLWNCAACKRQFTAKVGTIFHDSPLPLCKWLPAYWLIVNAKNGISSCELARALGVTQKTAWHMGHRIRTAIQRGGGIIRMDGIVEVDESFIGGLARNMHKDRRARAIKGTGGAGKTAVMGLLQRHSADNPVSRVIAKVVPNVRRHVLITEIQKHVATGTEVHTDAAGGYKHAYPVR